MRDILNAILRWPYTLGPLELSVMLFGTICLMLVIGVAALV